MICISCSTMSWGAVAARRFFAGYVTWLLLAFPRGHGALRGLKQAGELSSDDIKVVLDTDRRPFLALKDPINAGSEDVQRLYEQTSQVSTIAYLLFAAAKPFVQAPGVSGVFLQYLTPTLLRLYTSNPGRSSSTLARQLYELSLKLCGTPQLQTCHYELYTALNATFTWVRDNIPLRLQEVPGLPLASIMWPDMSLTPALNLSAKVAEALLSNQLDDQPLGVTASCGLTVTGFGALVPDIVSVLIGLHADLPLLQQLAKDVDSARWSPDYHPNARAGELQHPRELLKMSSDQDANSRPQNIVSQDGSEDRDGDYTGGGASTSSRAINDKHTGNSDTVSIRKRRLSMATLPSNFFYSVPTNFAVAPPATMPPLMIPLVFHIMLYKDSGNLVGPAKYDQAGRYIETMVKVANYMSKPSNIQFFTKVVRNNPDAYPYLLLNNRTTWLDFPFNFCSTNDTSTTCFSKISGFMYTNVLDYPRSVNIFIASDATVSGIFGFAFPGGSDVDLGRGYVFVSWDSLSFDGSNSATVYHDGSNTLLHELFHHLGLKHTFAPSKSDYSTDCYTYDDYVIDTPVSGLTRGTVYSTAISYCVELFWGRYGGNWDATYARWSTTLGIPETDKNAWADSCHGKPGYDELGNYMTYNTPVCFAALGHFTPGQVQRAHYVTAELNPVTYAWGQYYAQNATQAPPQLSPSTPGEPPPVNFCQVSERGACPCKTTWQYYGRNYSFCASLGYTENLFCEVEDRSMCSACNNRSSLCVLKCAGTASGCGLRSPVYISKRPPPQRPPSPPPMPPPPPPRNVPPECKKSSSGCDCRSTWKYNGSYYSYCAAPNGYGSPLRCQVTPSCPTFDISNPYQDCPSSLTPSYCSASRVYISTTGVSSPPPNWTSYYYPSPPSRRQGSSLSLGVILVIVGASLGVGALILLLVRYRFQMANSSRVSPPMQAMQQQQQQQQPTVTIAWAPTNPQTQYPPPPPNQLRSQYLPPQQ